MNIVCFPSKTMDISVLRQVLEGGLEKMKEAGVVLVGGHSIDDQELKYGLSVTGTIHPQKLVTKAGSGAGDKLILTKPLGTGIIGTAIKGGIADEEIVARVSRYMASLNNIASEVMQEIGVHACTDITGFGLLGHACEMIQGEQTGMMIYVESIPIFTKAVEFARMGLIPGGTYRNMEFRSNMIEMAGDIPQYMQDIIFDPQTSGGLLISVSAVKAEDLLAGLRKAGVTEAAIIGEVIDQPAGRIIVK